jgi:hypothetical protein
MEVLMRRGLVIVALAAWITAGCRTQFYGDAKFPSGPKGCHRQCKADGMDMAAFVYVGKYSTACACRPRQQTGDNQDDHTEAVATAAAQVAAAAALEQQRRQRKSQKSSKR